jgi:hypothetical protein
MEAAARTARSITELTDAVAEFRETYQTFAKKNKQFFLIDEDVQAAFRVAQGQDDIRRGAKTFSDGIWEASRAVEKKAKIADGKWTTKLGKLLRKLYPLARLSLGSVSAIGEVRPPDRV